MVLGRIIVLTDRENHSLIRARWLTKVFVTRDVLSFLAQSAGKIFYLAVLIKELIMAKVGACL